MAKQASNVKTHKEDPILTFTEAGEMLGRHRSTISRWVKDGILKPYTHPSKIPGVRQSDVHAFLTFIER